MNSRWSTHQFISHKQRVGARKCRPFFDWCELVVLWTGNRNARAKRTIHVSEKTLR
jgi:hypothetical protein